jgi:hypothetical protein
MFVLPSDPNPLSGLLTSAIGGVQAHGKQQAQQGELQRVLSGLNAESSPLDWFRAIEGVRDPEIKANLREGYKQHLEAEKIGMSQRNAAQAAQQKKQAAEESRQHQQNLLTQRQNAIDARIQKRAEADLDLARKMGIKIPGEQIPKTSRRMSSHSSRRCQGNPNPLKAQKEIDYNSPNLDR